MVDDQPGPVGCGHHFEGQGSRETERRHKVSWRSGLLPGTASSAEQCPLQSLGKRNRDAHLGRSLEMGDWAGLFRGWKRGEAVDRVAQRQPDDVS